MNSVEIKPYPLLSARQENNQYSRVGDVGLTVVNFSDLDKNGELVGETYIVPTDRQIKATIDHLSGIIIGSGVKFKGFVTASNGGLVPAKYLQDRLRLPAKVVTVGFRGYGVDNKPLDRLEIIHDLPGDYHIEGNSLGVDDIDDTGRSVVLMREMISKKTTGSVYMAALFRRPRSISPTEFVGAQLENDAWVRFPWDDTESGDNFRAIWTKKGIKEIVQETRLELMSSDNLEEQRELATKLDRLSGIRVINLNPAASTFR